MHRRTLLVGAGFSLTAAVAGCLRTVIIDESPFDLRFEEQTDDSADTVRERVIVDNISGEDQSISGYTLAYSSGYEYTFSGRLILEAGAKVAVISQGAGESVAESDLPTYYQDASLPELVLEDGNETVRLFDKEDNLLVEATYAAE